jgi:hypothetical protein
LIDREGAFVAFSKHYGQIMELVLKAELATASHSGFAEPYSNCYNVRMEVIFSASAFRHGYAEQDFYELLATRYLKIRSQHGLYGVYELLGRNLSGAYLHVIYRVLPDRRLRVFHMNTMTETQKKRYRRYCK